YRPKANAPLAELLFKQGAILFAKSNMHELALGSTSANPTFGYVKNPYDLTRIPGGSSGGTARRSRRGSFRRDWAPTPPAQSACRPIFAGLPGFALQTRKPTSPIR